MAEQPIYPNETARENTALPRKTFILMLMAIIPGMMMVMIDSTAMNVAITNLSHNFDVSFDTLQWVITGYMLAMSVTIPLSGWFSDKIGAARAFMVTVTFFVIGSVLCAMAQDVNQLIVFRIIQGLGGGMIQPIGMAMIFRLAPDNRKGQIMGMLGIPMLLAPASGPVLSGWLLETISWHWIFWINVPIGIITLALASRHLLKKSPPQISVISKEKKSLDAPGLFLAPSAFVLLALSINLKSSLWAGWLMGGAGFLLLVWLWFHELRHPHPILEVRAFREVRFRRGMLISWIQYIALNGSLVFIPQYLQNFRAYSPFEAGLVMSMLAVTSGLLMPVGGRLFDRIGIRPLAGSGLSVIGIALLLLSQMNEGTSGMMIGGIVGLMGIGMGLCMMSLNTYILQSAPPESISRVTPMTSASANLVIPLAIAGLNNFLLMRATVRETETVSGVLAGLGAYSDTFMLAACIALAGALLSLLLKPNQKNSDPQQ
ncbi:DHA2 family efflux MFS transporter permease subunit [Paenibacillus sp. LMG 31459]|uniref:DHA2 family efflux MFS transporter permease subunit n=1 Tax=Paenibacillus phytohabitans TaxID=2654978 RepID=A0ABX1YDS6_9BACL|nr:MDR family MFS transporter [Paenibacillus phytohabitans]NOU78956.1 DHA2 family efflux MFS transporter permease subunit [Paenibacillus phytohabitans]